MASTSAMTAMMRVDTIAFECLAHHTVPVQIYVGDCVKGIMSPRQEKPQSKKTYEASMIYYKVIRIY